MSIAKHLPSGCVIRRGNRADVGYVAGLLRPADRDEMEALEGQPAVFGAAGLPFDLYQRTAHR